MLVAPATVDRELIGGIVAVAKVGAVAGDQSLERQRRSGGDVEVELGEDVPVPGVRHFAPVVIATALVDEVEDQVEVAAPRGSEPASPVTGEPACASEPCVRKADPGVELIGGGRTRAHVEHGRHAVPPEGGEGAREEVDAVDHLRIEDAEDAGQVLEMERREELETIEGDQHLVVPPAPDVEASGCLVAGRCRHRADGAVEVVTECGSSRI